MSGGREREVSELGDKSGGALGFLEDYFNNQGGKRLELVRRLGTFSEDMSGEEIMLKALKRLGYKPEAEVVEGIIGKNQDAFLEFEIEVKRMHSQGNLSTLVDLTLDLAANIPGASQEEIVGFATDWARQQMNNRDIADGWR